ncbi:hypothetical protein QTP86_011435 [Hemibagrus guttatus]|nr:hypothetical protein QTP86_011435 [Hemibagrus guttatus]
MSAHISHTNHARTWYCMRKSGVAEKYVRVVQDMYERSRTVVRCAVVMDQLSEEVRQESPWTMMFADDIVICSESREQVEENLERWRFALERRGMKVSRSKTEYMCVNEREGSGTVRLQGEEVKKVQEFKYLGSTVQSNGECGKEELFIHLQIVICKAFAHTHSTYQYCHLVDSTKCCQNTGPLCRPDWRHLGPTLEPGLACRRAPGGRVFACGTRPGTAQRKDIGPPSRRPTTRRKEHKGPVQCGLSSSHGQVPRRPKPWTKNLAFGTWNVTSLGGKEPELVREVERYWLEIVGLASTHSLGSGTQLLERGWTLFFPGVPHGERRRAGVGLLIAPQLSHHVLEFSLVNERVVSLRLRAGNRCLTVVSAYGPNGSVEYPTFLETLRGVLEGAPTADSIVFLGDFNAHVGNDSDTWA